MADISALGNLNSAEPLDLDMYADVKVGGAGIPPAGRYTVRAPETFPATAFGRTNAGYLSAQVDPTIVGPTSEGYTIRFTKVSAKSFRRGDKFVSQLGDYLRATGETGAVDADPQAQADAVERTAGRIYEVIVDWRAYNKETKFVLEGMKNFPTDGKGGHLPFTTDPVAKDENGEPQRLRANLVVTKYIPIGA
jgi:hypothetical protein